MKTYRLRPPFTSYYKEIDGRKVFIFPPEVAQALGLVEGMSVEMEMENGDLVISVHPILN